MSLWIIKNATVQLPVVQVVKIIPAIQVLNVLTHHVNLSSWKPRRLPHSFWLCVMTIQRLLGRCCLRQERSPWSTTRIETLPDHISSVHGAKKRDPMTLACGGLGPKAPGPPQSPDIQLTRCHHKFHNAHLGFNNHLLCFNFVRLMTSLVIPVSNGHNPPWFFFPYYVRFFPKSVYCS